MEPCESQGGSDSRKSIFKNVPDAESVAGNLPGVRHVYDGRVVRKVAGVTVAYVTYTLRGGVAGV